MSNLVASKLSKRRKGKHNPRPWNWEVKFRGMLLDVGDDQDFVFRFKPFITCATLNTNAIENKNNVVCWLEEAGIDQYEFMGNSVMFDNAHDAQLCFLRFA